MRTDLRPAAAVIRETVSCLDAANAFGISVGRDNRCECLFCSGTRKDTMRLYPGSRGFYCFRCHESGDVIKLVGQLMRCSWPETIQMLNTRFNIGWGVRRGRTADLERLKKAQKRIRWQNEWSAFQESVRHAEKMEALESYWCVCDLIQELKITIDMTEPKDRDAPFPKAWSDAIWEREKLACLRDELEYEINEKERVP